MLKNLFRHRKTLLSLVCMMAFAGAGAQTVINDEAGLKAMASDLAGSYVLGGDITLTSEWVPIGTSATPFTGTLDGAGHSIKGLTILSQADNVGLFSFTKNATMKNLRFPGVRIAGNKQAGAVAGQAINSTIDQVFVSGVVTGYDHIGGVVGDVRGDYNAGEVTTVTNCLSTAGVYSTQHQAGVLVGWINSGTIKNNVVLGSAQATGNGAGGITPIIDNGYAEIGSNVAAPAFIHGFGAPDNHRSHPIVGFINGARNLYVADNFYSVESKIYESGNLIEDFSEHDPDLVGEPMSLADIKSPATYRSIGYDETKWTLTAGNYPVLKGMTMPIDADGIFVMPQPAVAVAGLEFNPSAVSSIGRTVTITSDNPAVVVVEGTILKFVGVGTATVTYKTVGDTFANGAVVTQKFDVTSQNYNISTAQDLLNIKNNLDGDYTLANDIDMAGVAFTPMGEFTGSLDGKGFVIRNLTFNDKNRNESALFSTARGATIKNLGIEGANIVGNANVAALVGRLYGGSITECYVADSYLEGRDHVAAFTGDLNRNGEELSTIANCISDARIFSRSYQASGIAGVANGGLIENCLFSGIVDNTGGVAGLISLIDNNDWETYKTTVRNNLSAPAHLFGGMSGISERMLHLAGRGADVVNNYALATTNLDAKGGRFSGEGNKDGVEGATVADDVVRTKDFYATTLGWDFDNVWKFFDGTEGKMYPVLKWMKAPLKVTVYDIPSDLSLLYSDGSEKIDLSSIHGSWGQQLTFNIVEGADRATVVPEENVIYAGDEGGYLNSTGDVKVDVVLDDALTSALTLPATSFTFYVDKSGEEKSIATVEDFLSIAKNLQGNYVLTADIDMAGVEFAGFAVNNIPFSGNINGNGHKVKNLSVTFESGQNKGIFGQTSGGKISNIAFEQFTVNAQACNHVGFIGSANGTQFEKVALTGLVYGNDHVALFAGDADGVVVKDSYVWGEVSGYSQVGGFFGCTLASGATVSNSYFNGYAEATTRGWVGGFVGLVDKSGSTININNCVSIGNCSSTGSGSPHTTAPFIAGNNAGDTPNAIVNFTDNIYNMEAVMDGTDTPWPEKNLTAEGGNVVEATSVNASTLQQQATYTGIGWDFASVWAFDTANGYNFPVIKSIGYVEFNKETLGVGGIADNDAAGYVVYASGNVLTVAGTGANAKVNVLNAAGQIVATAVANGTCTVALPGAGLYIVSIADNGNTKAYKVLNR